MVHTILVHCDKSNAHQLNDKVKTIKNVQSVISVTGDVLVIQIDHPSKVKEINDLVDNHNNENSTAFTITDHTVGQGRFVPHHRSLSKYLKNIQNASSDQNASVVEETPVVKETPSVEETTQKTQTEPSVVQQSRSRVPTTTRQIVLGSSSTTTTTTRATTTTTTTRPTTTTTTTTTTTRPTTTTTSTTSTTTHAPTTTTSTTTIAPASLGNIPTVFSTYYNFPAQQRASAPPNIAIISLGGSVIQSDLQYMYNNALGYSGTYSNFSIVNLGGQQTTYNNSTAGAFDENALDSQIIMCVCPTSKITMYIGENSYSGFYGAINSAISASNNIISISWGGPESTFGSSELSMYNSLFQTATNAGIIVTVASGDNASTDGLSGLNVDFPSSSQYVISCGGTSVTNFTGRTEVAWSYNRSANWGTGGGLSTAFTNIQPTSVVKYPTQLPNSSYSGKRSVPDISANADPATGWTVYVNGVINKNDIGGTSCVAPLMAAYFGLVNKSGLGSTKTMANILYNAAISSYSTYFNDITSGNNDNSGDSGSHYWQCRAGYDQVTGLGSVKGSALATFITNA